jgi:tetratricopeptide (TPR) repeat protein
MKSQTRYQTGDRIGGRFQVHQALRGGMGEVYLCLELDTFLPFALKTFQQRLLTTPRIVRLFEEEVSIWIALENHPNIVRCYALERLDNYPFIILDWIISDEGQGTDLRSWLRRGPLDLRLALDLTIDVCRGLVHAQERQPGIVHRDLKPGNILIAFGQQAKITDFGLARVARGAGIEVGEAEGTPPYMAPEQWKGEEVDARTDIYAIGCILYELLAGSWPFQATTVAGFRRLHLEAEVPGLPDTRALPRSLDPLVRRCLAKRREERFATADDLMRRLALIYQEQFGEPPKTLSTGEDFTAEDHLNRGITYFRLKRYDDALADFEQAVRLEPSQSSAYAYRGQAYAALQRHGEALADQDKAIWLDPSNALAYNARGITYSLQGRDDEALADYGRAIQLDPNLVLALSNRAVAHHEARRYEEALADLNRVIELNPTYPNAYGNRGLTYSALKRHEQALADFTQGIQLEPTVASHYVNRGTVYHDLERYEEALADYDWALGLDPRLVEAHYNRGRTLHALKQEDQALAALDRAIELGPSDPDAYTSRGLVYADLGRYDQALADFDRAIQLDPDHANAYANRGAAYADLRRYDEALADQNKGIELDPTDARAYVNRGHTYADLKQHDRALSDYSQAIQLAPTMAGAYYDRGTSHEAFQQYNDALADYEQAVNLDPHHVSAFLNIGVILVQHQQYDDALPFLERAAELGHPRAAGYAEMVRGVLGLEPVVSAPSMDQLQEAFGAFLAADSLDNMGQALKENPLMKDERFLESLAQAIAAEEGSDNWWLLDRKMMWLLGAIDEQDPGLLARLKQK